MWQTGTTQVHTPLMTFSSVYETEVRKKNIVFQSQSNLNEKTNNNNHLLHPQYYTPVSWKTAQTHTQIKCTPASCVEETMHSLTMNDVLPCWTGEQALSGWSGETYPHRQPSLQSRVGREGHPSPRLTTWTDDSHHICSGHLANNYKHVLHLYMETKVMITIVIWPYKLLILNMSLHVGQIYLIFKTLKLSLELQLPWKRVGETKRA